MDGGMLHNTYTYLDPPFGKIKVLKTAPQKTLWQIKNHSPQMLRRVKVISKHYYY